MPVVKGKPEVERNGKKISEDEAQRE